MDEACVSQLIETIYSSAFEENGWCALLQTLRGQFHASHASFAVFSGRGVCSPFAVSTLDAASLEPYTLYYHKLDQAIPGNNLTLVPKNSPIFSIVDLLGRDNWINSEFHNDFLKNYDMSLPLVGYLDEAGDRTAYFVVHRPEAGKEYSQDEINLLFTLRPHLSRGQRIYREMEELRAKAGLLADALDTHGAASFMLDAAGRVLSVNKAAGEILTGGQLTVCEGRLMARHPQDDAALQGALRPPQHGIAPAEIMLRATAHTPALRLSITPVNGGSIPLFFDVTRTARTAFLVTATPLGPTAENLITAYGLTRAEAEVSLLLLQGAKAAQIAAARETSIGTVNTQLKNIYAKLGVTGHVELLVKLMGR